jgi:hypothetical protein
MTEAVQKDTAKNTDRGSAKGAGAAATKPSYPAAGLQIERVYTTPGVHPYA